MSATSAVVFAYHAVGVRGLLALRACGVDVRLVVTHADDPAEKRWYPSVAETCRELGLRCIAPASVNAPEVVAAAAACEPDHLYSFYCRQMIGPELLALPRRTDCGGAFNLHGSLLPRYRGRVPVNWAVIHGERETGATLHVMDPKPDRGAIVDQMSVPILPDDTAAEVFGKVVVAAEVVLMRSVPRLIDGSARPVPQRAEGASYFGGRRPEDGRIPATAAAGEIHNLVRALADPFPGAFFDDPQAGRVLLWRTQRSDRRHGGGAAGFVLHGEGGGGGDWWLDAADGASLRVLQAEVAGRPLSEMPPSLRLSPARVPP